MIRLPSFFIVCFAVFALAFAPTQVSNLSMSYSVAYAADSDHDGVDDAFDAFPNDATEHRDNDHDGEGDNADRDDDEDGYSDVIEIQVGTDPEDGNSVPADMDGDFIPDVLDNDIDGDGVPNAQDMNPTNPNIGLDTIPPVVVTPAPITIEATGAGNTVLLGTATATDNVSPIVTITNNAPAVFPVGTTIVTYTATDAAGNVTTTTQIVTVIDTIPPVITVPAAIVVDAVNGAAPIVNLGIATATDAFAVTVTNDAPATFPVGTTVVTYTATDANGNITTGTQNVVVNAVDTLPPVITAPAAITLEATGLNTTVVLGSATATDNVTAVVAVTNNAPALFPLGVTTVTYTATDTAGNTATAIQIVTVVDTTAPVITAPTAVTASSGDNLPVAVTVVAATATDLFAVTITSDAPATFPVGITTVTYTATDANGNASAATQLVTVNLVDVTAPVVTAPVAITIEATAIVTTVTLGAATATDIVNGVLVPTNNAPATFPVGTTIVTYTATDAAGNIGTAIQTVTITDTTAPSITAPAAVMVEATGVTTTVVLGTATASDIVDGVITPTSDAPVSFPVGVTTVTWTATDAAGNTGTATQTVTVNEVTSIPALALSGGASASITVPAGSTLFNAGASPVFVGPPGFTFPFGSISYSVTSPVGGSITTSLSFSTPLSLPLVLFKTDGVTYQSIPPALWAITGPNSIAITLTDGGPFDLDGMVNGIIVDPIVIAVDITPPVVTAPANITVEATGAITSVILGSATAFDLVDGTVSVTSDAPAIFPLGVTTVTYTATDAAGNTATATQVVTVVDTTAPTITAPTAVTASSGDNLPVIVTLGTASATDLVDGVVAVANDAPATFPVGVTTVTYTATDGNGNTATATQTVTVNLVDVTPPSITAPAAITLEATGVTTPVTLGTATATDIVDGVIIPTNDAPVTFPVGVTTVTYTATDANGNTATATQTVTVNLVDTIAPVISAPANIYTSTSTSQATVNIGTATAVDNVDGIVAVSNNAPASFPVGVTTITYTATDNVGNTATATQNIYVSFVATVGGGTGGGAGGGTTTPPTPGGGATVTTEAVYWHHNDHLGTPQALTNANGTVVWNISQTPFGITTVNEDPDGDGITVTNNFRFPGQYYDAETGLNYNYYRTYDPNTGYTQHDPIGLNGGMNPFAYVGGNPVIGVDPFGLTTFIVITRQSYGKSATIGRIYVASDRVPNTFTGYSLEPIRKKGLVPSGQYDAFVRTDHSPNRIELLDVPNNTNIQIHVGNYPKDSKGCFLVGSGKGKNAVSGSRFAMQKVLDVIHQDGSGKIVIKVVGTP